VSENDNQPRSAGPPSGEVGAGPSGILVIDKPKGFTSMDVCAKLRGRLKRAGAPKRIKVGHGGTLDPMATGVLVVLIGKATRLCDAIMVGVKEYEAEIDLAHTSTTDDAEGECSEFVPESADWTPPTHEAVREVCSRFVGEIMQRPPAFSALNVGGVRAYKLARQGKAVDLPARPVMIHEIELTSYAWPRATMRVVCGKGTYIRSLARDIGAVLTAGAAEAERGKGGGGMLTALRRTRVGRYSIEQAVTFQTLPDLLRQEHILPLPTMKDL
jgi:tRNA pseudouridine55 synthase